MKRISKSTFFFVVLILSLVLNPISTVLAISYEAQINVGFPSGSILLVGESTVLRIDILNTNPFILENTSFTNSLEVDGQTGLVVHSDGVLSNTCGGVVVADPDSTTIALSGGVVPAASGVTQGQCSITVRVLAKSPGTKNSYIPSYGNPPSWGGEGLHATARGGLDTITNATRDASITTLTVNPVETPSMDKSFSPSTVWAGESTQLQIDLYNNDVTNSITGATYTDTLPSPFVVSSPLTTSISGCGSGTISTSVGSNKITLNNGTILPETTCRIRVRVVSSAQGIYTNTIPAGPSGSGSLQTDQYVTNPSDVSAPVNVQSVGIVKRFSPDSFAQGDTSILTITLQNPSGTTYTNMHFDDILPGPLVVTGSYNVNQCGGTVSVSPDNKTITLDNGIIPPGSTTTPGTCTVQVTVTSPTYGGPYTNTIPAGELTGSITNILPASDDVTVVQRTILVDKDFSDVFIVENDTTTMTILLRNQASTAFTGVTFTDTMPAGLTIVGTPTASASCGTSAVVTTDGTSLTLTDGVIPAGSVATPGRCTITATVTSSIVNTSGYTNTIAAGDITSDQGIDNASGDSDIIRVYPINGNATVSKIFLTGTILSGSNSTLRIEITSPRDTGLSQIHLIDNLPGDMVVTGAPTTNSCGGTLNAAIGSQLIELINGTIVNPYATCRIDIPVTSYTPGTLTNSIPGNSLSTYEGRTEPNTRSANLNVTSMSMSKQFAPDIIAPGGLSLLTIFLRNDSLQPVTDVSLSDNLASMDYSPDGYTVRVFNDAMHLPTTDCGSGVITAANGSSSITMSGGTIPASDGTVDGLCRINVYVTGQKTSANLRTRTNTVSSSNVQGTLNGTLTLRPISNASDNLTIDELEIIIDKAFNPLSVYNGSYSTMTVELQNPSNAASLSEISFTDTMPAGMILANPVNASVGTCGGSITGNAGDDTFSFSGGSLAPLGSCTVSVQVGMTVDGNLVNTIPVGGVTSFEGAVNSNQEDETLTNAVGAYILKSFSPNPITVGEYSILSIQIFNTSTSTDLTGMGVTDNLPAGVTVAGPAGFDPDPPAITNTCGGTLTANEGDTSIVLSNATILQTSSCLMEIPVTSGAAGNYDNIIVSGDVTPPLDTEHAHDTLYVNAMSLGNRVWDDNGTGGGTANDGILNGSEPGIAGLTVNLYQDSNDDGTPDGAILTSVVTDANGYYRFDNLAADTYIVEVQVPSGYVSSAVNGGDPDTDTDNDNNGVDTSNPGFIRSNPVTLEATSIEPTNDNDPVTNPDTADGEGINEQSNRTVDFGFYRNFSLGNRVWYDSNGDGVQDGGETGIAGVTVRLYQDTDTNDVPDGSAIDFTVTDANGYYRFDELPGGSYIVEVVTPADYKNTNNAVSDPNGDVDLDHNGIVEVGINVRSNHVTLGPDTTEPIGETDPASNPESGEAADAQSNRTVDFGFTNAYSLGNRVWNDNGAGGGVVDNGIQDGTEPGFGGVTVNLYQDSNNDGTADGGVIATTTTNTDGYYRFDGLNSDTYIVEVVLPTGYQVSSVTGGDPDNDIDLDNNGVVPGAGVIRSNPVTLAGGLEPTDDDDPATNPMTGEEPNAYSNRTVDFGLYGVPLSLGDLVWLDNGGGNAANADNGVQDTGEPGVTGVTVRLYRETDLVNPIAITETDSNGNYLFSNLVNDSYRVEILIPTGYTRSSVFSTSTPTNPANTSDSDATNLSGTAPEIAQSNRIDLTATDLSIDFGLIEYASLGDRVWYDSDRDGVQDAGEDGVPGVTVELYTGTPGSGTLVDTTTTSGGGYYLFSDLTARSDYYVEFTLPANYQFSPSGAGTASTDSDVTTIAGSTGRTVNISLDAFEEDLTWDAGIYLPPASIGDLVWYDTNRDGIQDVGETGAANVRVDLFRPGVGADGIPATPDDDLSIANTLTDGSGNYLFNELLPGDYYVSFTAPSGYAISPQNQGADDGVDSDADRTTGVAATTTLDAGENDLTWDAGLYELASIGDYVWFDHGAGGGVAYNGIQDGTEPGIPGVTVNLYTSGNTLVGSTVTNASGGYLFSNLEPGDYYVEFIPPFGYSISPQDAGGNDASDSDADTTTGQTIVTTLDAGENDLTWDAGMYQYASIGDTVWDDNGAGGGTARDGIQDSGEPGVAGVTVTLYNGGGSPVGSPTTTDANGHYEFTELLPGDYFVIFSNLPAGYQFSPRDQGGDDAADSDADTTLGQTVTTTLSPGENDVTWDAGIHLQTAEIGDYVWYDGNGNGIQDGGETPADGVTVTLYNSTGSVVGTDVTDGTGHYLFTDLNPGYYYLEFTAVSGYNYTLSDQGGNDATDSDAIIPNGRTNMTQLSPGESDMTWDAGLYTNASLGDYVWEDWNMNGIQDTGETGVNGVTVELYHNTLGYIGSTTTADLTGNPGYYAFSDLVPGEYYVVFTAPSGYKLTTQNAGADDSVDSDANVSTGQTGTVVLSSGDNNLTLDAGLTPVFSVGNRVWFDVDNSSNIDTGEVGVSGVTVQIYNAAGTTEILVGPDGILGTADDAAGGVTTDATGHYLFSGLEAGDYMIALPASNFGSGAVLEGYYSTGTTRNDSGVLVESAAAVPNSNIDSDDNGSLQVGGTHDGAVISSTVSLGGVNPASEPIGETDLGSGGQGNVPGDNYGNMTVDFGFYHMQLGNLVWNDADNSGTVNSEGGMDGVTVELWSASSATAIASTTTAGGGLYSFDDLAAGNYFIRIPNTEFEGTETLRDYRSSTGGGSEPAPSPDTDTDDNDDNGSETGGILGMGGYIQTSTFALTPGSEGSLIYASGLTIENRVDLGVLDAPQVDLAITKDDGQTYYIADSTLTYTIIVTNNGPADVSGAVVSDTLPSQFSGWTWTCGGTNPTCDGGTAAPFSDTIDLDYGESLTYTVVATVSTTASGQLDNTAVITPPSGTTETDNTNNSATDTDQSASINIVKTDGVDLAAPGSVLTYHVTITNNGAVDLSSLVVTDTLPSDVTFIRAYQGANNVPPTTIAGNVLTWSYLDLTDAIDDLSDLPYSTTPAGNNVIEFDIEVEVIASPTNFSFTNTIEVEDTTTGANDSDDDTDYLMNVNLKSLTDTSEADSGSGTIANPEPVFIGEILDYTINIEVPPGTASNLQALDILDHGLAFVGCTNISSGTLTTSGSFMTACSSPTVEAEPTTSTSTEDQGRRVTFALGNVTNSGASTEVISITYQVIVLDIADNYNGVDNLNNTMTWSWDATSSITASATPVRIEEPEMSLRKTAQPTTATYGTPIDFTLEIAHAAISAAPAYDVILRDVLPSGLEYVPGTLLVTGLPETSSNYDPATYTITVNWDEFPLAATATITFQAAFIGPSPVQNEANVEWTSIEIDPQPSGDPVQLSTYNIHSTERWYDPADQTINDYGARSAVEISLPPNLPLTGFIPGVENVIPEQPAEKLYDDLGTMYLEIPKLGLYMPITGIPNVDGEWDLTWLSDQAGYLEGSTFPGQVGNTAITAHVALADGTDGPFHDLRSMVWGDEIILHMDGQKYTYELRYNLNVYPNDFSTFTYDGYSWLTLITCEGFNEYTETYDTRTLVKAVLVKTDLE